MVTVWITSTMRNIEILGGRMLLDKSVITITISDVNKLVTECQCENVEQYAYYVYRDDEIIARYQYSTKNKMTYWLSQSGLYSVKVFFIDAEGNKTSMQSEQIEFKAEDVFGLEKYEEKKKHCWDDVFEVTGELWNNRAIIGRMAAFDYKLENKDTYLGKLWALITPLIQIGTYWLVFGLGLRNGKDVDGYPYLAWMLIGLIPWFFISATIVKGANSIYAKSGIVSKMKFPIATAPISKVLQELYEFVVMLFIMFIILFFKGVRPSWYWLNLIYYFVYSIVFLASLSMVTSVLTMVARDFYKLLNSLIRLLFYITPILWVMDNMPYMYQKVMQYNPIFYIVRGFRESILYRNSFWTEWDMVIVMWAINILLYILGCVLQSKFRNKFVDLI